MSDAYNTTSWLDHIICSHDVQRQLVSIDILDRLPCSDHLPLCVLLDFNCDPNNVTTQIVEKQASVTFNWAKATTVEIEKYRTLTSELLKYIELLPAIIERVTIVTIPHPSSITCDDCNCTSAEQKFQIDQFYMQICTVFEKASRDSIPSFTVNSSRDYIIPGFTEHVEDLHTIARADYCSWRTGGKPCSGRVYIAMKQSRLRFKSALRYCKTNEDAMRSNAFDKSLMDKDMNSFWRGITKVNYAKIPLASTVENCVDELSICNMWKTHYDSLLNSVRSCEQNSEVTSKITNASDFTRKFSIASITSSFRLLTSGKASGVDGLAAEHFLNADRHIYVYLSLLFNSFMYHGYLPAEFMKTAIVLIIKCKTGNTDICLLAPSALGLQKLLEMCFRNVILVKIMTLFLTL